MQPLNRNTKNNTAAGTNINFLKDQFALKASPKNILGNEYTRTVDIAINGPRKSVTNIKATTEEVQLYLLPQRIPMIEIPAGATIVARKS